MNRLNFNEDDKQKLIDFLNMVAKSAKFEFNTTDIITYFKLLSHMQSSILPKLEANILEIKKITIPENSPEVQPEAPKGKGKK